MLAWAVHPSELLRPAVYLALLGVPFAISAALVLDPPSRPLRTALTRTLVVLIAVQIPFAGWQAYQHGFADPDAVQGTLAFANAGGSHLIAAILVVASVWLVASRRGRLTWWVVALAGVLLAEAIVADAKQVLFVLPAAVAVAAIRYGRLSVVFNGVLVALALVLLVVVSGPASQEVVYRLEQARHGNNGKQETARIVWRHMASDPESIAFGLGPAETVSRAAFMTAGFQSGVDSPFRALGLQPSSVALEAAYGARAVSGGGTSFNSGVSSMLGLIGDLGVFGFIAYGILMLSTVIALHRIRTPSATAAMCGWIMFALLGMIFDWWEQPPFTVFLGVLTGLALTSQTHE